MLISVRPINIKYRPTKWWHFRLFFY